MNDTGIGRAMEIVEDALRSMPLEKVPPGLQSRVMRRVRAVSAAPKFAFPWLEGAISLMLSTLLTVVSSLLLSLSPAAWMRLAAGIRNFFILPANRLTLFAGLAGAAMLFLCLLFTLRMFVPIPRAPSRSLRLR